MGPVPEGRSFSLPVFVLSVIVALGVGFVGGTEYKAYQVRSALESALNPGRISPDKAPQKPNAIPVQMGEWAQLTTIKLRVTSYYRRGAVARQYGDDINADGDAIFAIFDFEVENTSKQEVNLSPGGEWIWLIDQDDRKFKAHYGATSALPGGAWTLSVPAGVTKKGSLAYEVPKSSTRLGAAIGKSGTNDYYVFILR